MGEATFLRGRAPTQLRGLAWLSLSDTAIVQAGTVVSDGGGGGTTSWAAAGTFACRVAPLTNRPMNREVGGQIDERSTHVLTTPPSSSIDVKNRVVVVNRGTFEVTGVRSRTDAYTNVCEVIQIS